MNKAGLLFTALAVLLLSVPAFTQELVFEFGEELCEVAESDLVREHYGRINKNYMRAEAMMECENIGWTLPSKDQLDAMYIELHQKGLGNFTSRYYVSASKINGKVYYQNFDDGSQDKDYESHIYAAARCIKCIKKPQ